MAAKTLKRLGRRVGTLDVLATLNLLLEADPETITLLVGLRTDAQRLHRRVPAVRTHLSTYGMPLMGALELLNTILETECRIEPKRAASGKILEFVLMPP
jgi:hypothetical protein